MNSIIGFSIRGKTYYFLNIFSKEQLHNLKQFADNYQISNPTVFEKGESAIIEQFKHDVNRLFGYNMYLLNIDEIFIIK